MSLFCTVDPPHILMLGGAFGYPLISFATPSLSRIENSFWSHYPENKDKQVKFWQKFPYIKELHGTITSNIGKNFIDENENLIS